MSIIWSNSELFGETSGIKDQNLGVNIMNSRVFFLVLVISVIVALFTLCLSKPENKKLAWITGTLILIIGVLQIYIGIKELRARHEVELYVVEELIRETDNYFDVLSYAIVYGTDSWLPETSEDFFSKKVANIISYELNIETEAPIFPKMTWREYIGNRSKSYREVLRNILDSHSSQLDKKLIKTIKTIERAPLLSIAEQRIQIYQFDMVENIHRPPLLCWGLESLVEDSLNDFHYLYLELLKKETAFGIKKNHEWLRFPREKLNKFISKSRFDKNNLEEWRKKYCNLPGRFSFGDFDPNKGPPKSKN